MHVRVQLQELDLGYNEGKDRLMLRLPVTVRHIINAQSPLAPWRAGPAALGADADAEIYVAVSPNAALTSRALAQHAILCCVLCVCECTVGAADRLEIWSYM